MLTISEAFTYAGVFALHAAAVVDGAVWVHKMPFPEMRNPSVENPGLKKLIAEIRNRGEINPAHWEKLGATAWRP